MMYHLSFLSSTKVLTGIVPWDWKPTTPFPQGIRGDKKARDEWASNPHTVSNFYTGYEGLNDNLRIRQGGENGNPPVKEHFLVADFDSPVSEEMALAEAKKFNPQPNRLEKTLSGNWRAVWFLEVPIVLPSYEFAKFFKKTFAAIAFAPEKMLPGFDRGAWEAPERFWTNSGQWFVIHNEKIPADRIIGWQFLASEKFNWKKAFNSIAIPAELAAEELQKNFPRFSIWPGEFVLGAQGPSFWVDGSTSPMSAIVRETGMQTFSDHAGKGFFPWVELLGSAFTKQYEADAVGRAVQGIFYDKRSYWLREDCGWQAYDVSNLTRILQVDRGVSVRPDTNGVSDIARTIRHVQRSQTVVGAAPFVCRRPGLVNVNGSLFLNTHTTPFLSPAPGLQVWGPEGNFPWLSNFFEKFFDRGDAKQLQHFLSWLAHFYRSGITFTPRSGLLTVVAGEADAGKSFLAHGIIGKMVGGAADAGKLLSGDDNFGSENFQKALWAIDDGKTSADYIDHRRFSEGLKRAAANDTVSYHEKYRVPCVISWFGRIIISLNKDAESLRIIPDLEISIRDKISLYHCADKTIKFPSRDEIDAIVDRELAFFCSFLRDFVIPEEFIGSNRFGVKPWQDAEIFGRAQQSSPAQAFREILDSWSEWYFTTRTTDADFWEGGSVDLNREIQCDASLKLAMQPYNNINVLGRRLHSLSTS